MDKSGDIGRLRLDGSYEFMGRRDSQVKLNGQRVELDEITGAIPVSYTHRDVYKRQDAWFELLRHQRFPFAHIEKMYLEQRNQEGRLFHIALSYQNSQMAESRDTSVLLSGRWHYSGYQSEQLCIHLTNLFDNKCYSVDYDYLTQFFAREEIERLHHTLCNIPVS